MVIDLCHAVETGPRAAPFALAAFQAVAP